jgi:cell division protein FtsW
MIKKISRQIQDTDKLLLAISTALFIFGLLNIATASSSEIVVGPNQNLLHYFIMQSIFLVVGIIPFFYIIFVDTKRYRFYAMAGFIIIMIALTYITFNSFTSQGAKLAIDLPMFGSIQPSEFAKPVIIVALALIFESNKKIFFTKEKINAFGLIIFISFLIPFIVAVLHKDMGTATIIAGIATMMILYSPIQRIDKVKMFGILITVSALLLSFYIILNGNPLTKAQMSRINYFDPCSRYETTGYQTCNGFIAINDGGLFGLGMGKSKQKYSYIPSPHTDAIFAIVAEEYGFIFSSFVFAGYIVVLKRIFDISSKAITLRGRYMAFGVGCYIFAHIFINLGGLFVVIPLTGVPLPFLSYGGSYALSLIISLAIVQRVHIETKNQHLKI